MSGFWVEFRKDFFKLEYLKSLDLNDRQIQSIKFVKENGRITNSEYQANFGEARNTATRDLSELVNKGILKSSKSKGAGSYYEL
jgi:ATP-dependent DNA helicase RecG